MKFEDILEEINGFGPFQILIIILLCIPRIVLPCHFLLNNFIAAFPPHHCDISTLGDGGLLKNLTHEQRLTVSIPVREDGVPKSCEMFAEPQFQLLANGSISADLPTVQCQSGWVYDNSTFTSTLATEWDLVCDRKSLTKTTGTIFFVGVMMGGIAFGFLSDKYGRRNSLLASYIMSAVFGFSSAFANSYVLFAVLRFLTGVGLTGISIISIALSIEWVDTGHRSFIGVIGSLAWSAGNMLLAGFAFLVNDWRTLMMTVTAPLGVAVLTWWWIPESARWLLVNNKVERAHFYLDKCAKINKRQKLSSKFKQETLSEILEKQDTNYTYLHLIKTPKMRRLTLLTGTVWYGVSSAYYGISLNISGFGLNMHLTHFIYAAIEVPAKLMIYCFLNIIGRRKCQAGTLLLTGICIAINIFLPQGLWHMRAVVAILGKGLSEASFTAVFLYTTELYPTVVRQNSLGYTTFMSRLGASLAPLILLLEDVWTPLPQVIICSLAIISGLTVLLLPETLNVRLPETIDDIEKPRASEVSSHSVETAGVFLESMSTTDI
ncbi:solute carrier family 22 member 7-like isoform X2 [Epinephelus lanceolatus]|uniref:solute carrier family 22 member 7-like n=1 Tax=Epinephelus lanceolatus TaxID=310571 RepID=UPI00144513CF|nr:solute carrier family 22 member 7-like [Epinephelus lanceolatus]XP_033494179.1 solute carrier family 22 member 7-like [Epinephelus lanceolatus]XP_033494183.1 solute carrier family 22 member 7-like [Epinephelus lanceolatus]